MSKKAKKGEKGAYVPRAPVPGGTIFLDALGGPSTKEEVAAYLHWRGKSAGEPECYAPSTFILVLSVALNAALAIAVVLR